MATIKQWVETVGFRSLGGNTYRGNIHTDDLQSVQKALIDMKLTCACQKPNFEIWSNENDEVVVLINHSK